MRKFPPPPPLRPPPHAHIRPFLALRKNMGVLVFFGFWGISLQNWLQPPSVAHKYGSSGVFGVLGNFTPKLAATPLCGPQIWEFWCFLGFGEFHSKTGCNPPLWPTNIGFLVFLRFWGISLQNWLQPPSVAHKYGSSGVFWVLGNLTPKLAVNPLSGPQNMGVLVFFGFWGISFQNML